jgi:hypothetical protein
MPPGRQLRHVKTGRGIVRSIQKVPPRRRGRAIAGLERCVRLGAGRSGARNLLRRRPSPPSRQPMPLRLLPRWSKPASGVRGQAADRVDGVVHRNAAGRRPAVRSTRLTTFRNKARLGLHHPQPPWFPHPRPLAPELTRIIAGSGFSNVDLAPWAPTAHGAVNGRFPRQWRLRRDINTIPTERPDCRVIGKPSHLGAGARGGVINFTAATSIRRSTSRDDADGSSSYRSTSFTRWVGDAQLPDLLSHSHEDPLEARAERHGSLQHRPAGYTNTATGPAGSWLRLRPWTYGPGTVAGTAITAGGATVNDWERHCNDPPASRPRSPTPGSWRIHLAMSIRARTRLFGRRFAASTKTC